MGGRSGVGRRRWLGLRPEPDVAENGGEPGVEAAYPVQGENGAHRQSPTPLLLLTAVLHLDVDEERDVGCVFFSLGITTVKDSKMESYV